MSRERRIVFDIGDLRMRIECKECHTEAVVNPGRWPYPPTSCPGPGCTNARWPESAARGEGTFRQILALLNEVAQDESLPVEVRFEIHA